MGVDPFGCCFNDVEIELFEMIYELYNDFYLAKLRNVSFILQIAATEQWRGRNIVTNNSRALISSLTDYVMNLN
ncbi:hypothetical protein L2E82_47391 [Cichorium intybus]|uniref:Uncharacterized protein n=1 Tax=Cichorium intybus TaxID=13427 RepID=A0ACB8YVN2_CICIN|nr:hypothetical protein L2E82_47391 [Cichorium intybus]